MQLIHNNNDDINNDTITIYHGNNNDDINNDSIRLFKIFAIFSQYRGLSPTCTLKWPGHNHVQIMSTHRMFIPCNMPCGIKGQLSY